MIASIIICLVVFFASWVASFVVGLLLGVFFNEQHGCMALPAILGLFLMWLGWLPAGIVTAIVAWNMGW